MKKKDCKKSVKVEFERKKNIFFKNGQFSLFIPKHYMERL